MFLKALTEESKAVNHLERQDKTSDDTKQQYDKLLFRGVEVTVFTGFRHLFRPLSGSKT